jgi:ADP-glucose pyrophosphorylase
MKIKASSLVFSSALKPESFPGLGAMRPRFLLPYAGRFTYLDMFLSPLMQAGVRSHLIETQRFAELTHGYMENAWGMGSWKVIPFLPETGNEPFDSQMLSVLKDEFASYIYFACVDHPCWYNSAALANEFRMRIPSVQPVFNKKPAQIVLVERSRLLAVFDAMVKKAVPASEVLARAFRALCEQSSLRRVAVDGFYLPIESMSEYIAANLGILEQQQKFQLLYEKVPLQSGLGPRTQAVIARGAEFYRSSLADECVVRGRIYDSVLYPGVEIGKNTEVRDSVILPGVKIGANARINRCLIDSPLEFSEEVKLHVADGVRVGSARSTANNRDYGDALQEGYSYIGSGTISPKGVSINGACYIAPGLGKTAFSRSRVVGEGRSIQ